FQRLYELGFRRILVKGSGPVGCYPKVLAAGKRSKKKRSGKDDDECDEELQSVAASFNSRLGQVTTQLNSDVGYQAFIFINAFDSGTDIIANPRSYANVACCGQGPYNGVGRCTVASNLCPDRGDYVFWDSVHETQKVVELIVYQIFYGSIDFIAPMNLSTIMAVDHWT
ncbi:GDSL esterase/lipase At5g33370, partial [Linum perenne]